MVLVGFKPDLWRPTGFLQCFDTVGLVIWPVKIISEMTYYVLSGTLNPTHSLTNDTWSACLFHSRLVSVVCYYWGFTSRRVHFVCFRLVFSQSLLSLDLIEDFLALKTEEATQQNANNDDLVINGDINWLYNFNWINFSVYSPTLCGNV